MIYGAAGSIGGAVARAFAGEGARVHLAGRTLEDVGNVAAFVAAARSSIRPTAGSGTLVTGGVPRAPAVSFVDSRVNDTGAA